MYPLIIMLSSLHKMHWWSVIGPKRDTFMVQCLERLSINDQLSWNNICERTEVKSRFEKAIAEASFKKLWCRIVRRSAINYPPNRCQFNRLVFILSSGKCAFTEKFLPTDTWLIEMKVVKRFQKVNIILLFHSTLYLCPSPYGYNNSKLSFLVDIICSPQHTMNTEGHMWEDRCPNGILTYWHYRNDFKTYVIMS